MFTTDKESILAMPWFTLGVWLAVLVVASVGLTWWFMPPDFGLIRTLIGGVLMGVMSWYMLFINRILVS